MKKLISLLAVFTLSILTIPLASSSSLAAPADEVTIPDSNLQAAIRTELDLTDDEPITEARMASLHSLYLSDTAPVTNLTGLEAASNLEKLGLGAPDLAQLTSVTPLRNLPKLKTFSIFEAQNFAWSSLADLPASIRTLTVEDSSFSSFEGFPTRVNALTTLTATNNEITSLAGMPAGAYNTITTLNISNNAFDDLCAQDSAFRRFTALSTLSASGSTTPGKSMFGTDGHLSCIPELWPGLQSLDIRNSNAHDLSSFANFTNLQGIWVTGNRLTDVSAIPTSNLSIGCFAGTSDFEIDATELTFTPPTITWFDGSNIPFQSTPDDVTANADGSYTFKSADSTYTMFKWNKRAPVNSASTKCTFTGRLTVNLTGANTQVIFKDPDLETAVKKALDLGPEEDVTEKNILDLHSLDLNEDAPVTDFTGLEYARKLKHLYLANQDFTEVPSLTALSGLSLKTFKLRSGTGLTWNLLKDLPSSLTALEVSSSGMSEFKDFPSHLTNLRALDLSYNPISSWEGLPDTIYDTVKILNINGAKFPNLCASDSPSARFTDLQTLRAQSTGTHSLFDDGDVGCVAQRWPHIQSLDLGGARITDGNLLTGFDSLETARLGHNQLSDISMLTSAFSDLYYCEFGSQYISMAVNEPEFTPPIITGIDGETIPLEVETTNISDLGNGKFEFTESAPASGLLHWKNPKIAGSTYPCDFFGRIEVTLVESDSADDDTPPNPPATDDEDNPPATNDEDNPPADGDEDGSEAPAPDGSGTASSVDEPSTTANSSSANNLPITGALTAPLALISVSLLLSGTTLLAMRRRL